MQECRTITFRPEKLWDQNRMEAVENTAGVSYDIDAVYSKKLSTWLPVRREDNAVVASITRANALCAGASR